jgi:tetratricopeptide (TPR) repeat protein
MELTLEQALQKGIEAHKAGKVQEADQYYTAILQAQPKHPDANHNMGVLAVGVGKLDQALPFLKTALEANPSIEQFWLSYIDALIKLEQLADAKAVLDQAKSTGVKSDAFDQLEKQLGPSETKNSDAQDPPQDQQQSVINLYNQGKLQQALDQAKTLLQQFPNSSVLYNICGACSKGLGKFDDAIEAYNKAISIKPDFADAYYNLGIALKEKGKLEQAIEAYTKVLSFKPDYIEAYNNIGINLQEQGKLEEATEAFDNALSIKPDYAEAHNNLGNTLKEQGKLEEAIEAYTKVLSIKPDFAEAYSNIGIIYQEQGELEKAIEAINKALVIKPGYADAHYNRGNALKDQGKLEEAIEAYNKATALKPDYAEAYNNIGFVRHDQGKLEEAIEAYNKAISLKPDYVTPWQNIFSPLQAIKTRISSPKDLKLFYPKAINSKHAKVELGILDYRLHRGQENEERYLEQTLGLLSSADDIVIRNPKFDNNSNDQKKSLPDKMVALVHFGRSGTGLLHSLIDGHSEASTLPSIYFSEYFDHSTWMKIISDGWDGIIDRFMEIYDVLFDASSAVPIIAKSTQMLQNIGIKEGMANVGDQRDEVLRVDRKLFRSELGRLMGYYDEAECFLIFQTGKCSL